MALPTAFVSIGTVLDPRAYVAAAKLDLSSLLVAGSVETVEDEDFAGGVGAQANETRLFLRDFGETSVDITLRVDDTFIRTHAVDASILPIEQVRQSVWTCTQIPSLGEREPDDPMCGRPIVA